MRDAPDFEAIRVLGEPATAWARSHRSADLIAARPHWTRAVAFLMES